MRKSMIAILFFAVSSSLFAQGGPQIGGALPPPLPLFPRSNWWNVNITAAPVDPNSEAIIEFIGATRGLHPDFGGDAPLEPATFGIPYVTVPGTQPLVPVTFLYASESDYAAPGRPAGYPIPEEAKTQPKWIEGGFPGTHGSGDRHMLIVDRDNRILYELYALQWNAAAARWEAGSGAIWELDENHRRREGWTSADAAGLAILPGLVRFDEVYGAGPIEHAFRVTVRATNGFVYPASHRAGNTRNAPPLGTRLRLKASRDISSFPASMQKIFQAMKTYGLIVADNGSDLFVSGAYDPRWRNDVLNPAFRSLKGSDFEVIELGWRPSPAPRCTAPNITVQPSGAALRPGMRAQLALQLTGTAPVVQWFRGEVDDYSNPLPGLPTVTTEPLYESTSFWARVSNECGVARTAAARFEVTGRGRGVRR